MTDRMDSIINALGTQLMTAVVRSGCIRKGREFDIALASRVMREELKMLLVKDLDGAGKYDDERAVAMGTGSGLAMASVTAECIRRILAERDA
jgi:hypothetical protein